MDTLLSAPSPPPGRLRRTALAERVRTAAPAIVSLVAPAGFGKSAFARELLEGYPAGAVCDCRDLVSAADLARRVVPALCDEDPGRTAALAQLELALGESRLEPESLGVVLAAWRRPGPPSAFVFDEADDVGALSDGREVLTKLLAARPDERVVVLCSRLPLRLRLARFAPPHRILTLRAEDLAFTPGEVRELLAGSGASEAAVERAIAIAGGWPIAALLLARFAHEGRLEPLLDRLDDVAYEELYDYVAEEVLGSALPAAIDGLLATTIPNATERDVRLAVAGDAAFDVFQSFARTSPFVGRDDDGALVLAPLAASTLRERYAERRTRLFANVAGAYEDAAEFQRAAEIHLARGDRHAAAAALEQIETFEAEAPVLSYARALASLERDVIVQHPRLWSVGALARMFTADPRAMLDELDTVVSHPAARSSPSLRVWLDVFRIVVLAQLGELEAAFAHVEELRRRIAAPDLPATRIHGWLQCLRGLVSAPLGRTVDAERDLAAARPFVASVPVLAGGSLVALAADVARVRGDRAAERERLERALGVHAQRGGLRNFAALYHAEAAFGAWLAGDDAELARQAFALDDAVERDGVRGVAFFAAMVQGRPAQPEPADLPKLVVAGRLVAAAAASDEATALRHAESARELAAATGLPYMQLLASLALAELAPARAAALRAEAAAHACRIDAPELHAAVDALATGERAGFLEPFARRFRNGAGAASARPKLEIELVSGRVLRDGAPLALAEREHALLTAVALRPEAVTRERLADMLWPDLGERAARNAFHVCLHRAKARLATDDAIAHTSDGYRLGVGVRVDLWEIERSLASARSAAPDDAGASGLRELYERLRVERPARFASWEWFEPTERRLRELRGEVAQALANRALTAGRHGDALALAHEMIAYDPCDEPAREIAIRAHLAAGDRAAALRHYRQYRDVLQSELQCEPSESIARLVGAHT